MSSTVDTVADCVCTSSELAWTMTCSVRPPTSSVARTLAGTPELTTTLFRTARLEALQGDRHACTCPVMSAGTVNTPVPDDTVVNVLTGARVLDDNVGAGNDAAVRVDDHAGNRRRRRALRKRAGPRHQREQRRRNDTHKDLVISKLLRGTK